MIIISRGDMIYNLKVFLLTFMILISQITINTLITKTINNFLTSHSIIINIIDDEIQMQLQSINITQFINQNCCCFQDVNIHFNILENDNNYIIILLTYNDSILEITINKTYLWTYIKFENEKNITANFIYIELHLKNNTFDKFLQFYAFNYIVYHEKYNLTVNTYLTLFNSEKYNNSNTMITYIPANKSSILSLEFIKINSTITLSQQYNILSKIIKELSKLYENNNNETLKQLADNYHIIKDEIKHLSKLIKKHLKEYDKEILNNFATIIDPEPQCTICQIACPLIIIGGCWLVCIIYPIICGFCALLWFYLSELQLSCAAACHLAGLCP